MDLNIKERAEILAAKFETQWGGFRRYQAEHPLTAGWLMFGAGALVSAFLVWVF